MKNYFYAGNKLIDVITILEGGGRHQIKTFGDYLRSRTFNNLSSKIRYACQLILDIIPSCYERTLHNHFHKNFGINLFLEKYQEYLTKTGKDADNKGRFEKFLIDLGIRDKYFALSDDDKEIVKNFLSALGNLDQTSVSDAVQMIIRDLLFNPNGRPKPYIIYNGVQAWEYKDLLPDDCFDVNPFDIEIENDADGRLAYDRLIDRLSRIKSTLALFDDSGSLWDLFCENTTIIVNDPNNPTGYTDFNTESVNNFLRFLNSCKITLFLDEAYAESVEDRRPHDAQVADAFALHHEQHQRAVAYQGDFVAFDDQKPGGHRRTPRRRRADAAGCRISQNTPAVATAPRTATTTRC
ncbi:MAG: aminotransferase class I/II-fold pyridoxal phosphate-dependent enzyme [Alistipes indistinctus]